VSVQTLLDACLAIVDCEHKTAPIDPSGDYFAVGTPAMRGNRINYARARKISRTTFESWTRRLAPAAGDLLLAREAPVGPVVRIPPDLNVAPGQRTVLLRPDPEVLEPLYAFYLLTSPRQQVRLLEQAEGSTVPHLNVADVRSFRLPDLPSMDEQRAIASTLGALDEKIESNLRSQQLGLDLIQAAYERLAKKAGSRCGAIGLFAHELRERIGKDRMGGAVVLSAVSSGHLQRSDAYFNKRVHSASVEKYLAVPPGALAYNPSRANIGSIGINKTSALGAVSPVYVVATIDDDWRSWIEASLRSPQVRSEIETLSSGSVRQNLRYEDFASIEIPLPDLADLSDFGRFFVAWEDRSAAVDAETHTLHQLRDTLLPELLSGRIHVSETVDAVEAAR
jgi:type I restriction enzyme, S subunit